MPRRKQERKPTPEQLRARLVAQYALIPDAVVEDMRQSWDRMSYVQGDPMQTAFNEGMRHVYRAILSMREEHANAGDSDDDRYGDAELEQPSRDGSEYLTGSGDR